MTSRRKKLEAMLEAEPEDQTLRYMVAMESDREGDVDVGLSLFRGLMADPTPYVPAYLMAGQLLTRIGQPNAAADCYRAGISEATRQGNEHAAGEMAGFLDQLDVKNRPARDLD